MTLPIPAIKDLHTQFEQRRRGLAMEVALLSDTIDKLRRIVSLIQSVLARMRSEARLSDRIRLE